MYKPSAEKAKQEKKEKRVKCFGKISFKITFEAAAFVAREWNIFKDRYVEAEQHEDRFSDCKHTNYFQLFLLLFH